MNTSNLFQDSGFDLLPKNPSPLPVNTIMLSVAETMITYPEPPGPILASQIEPDAGKKISLAGTLLLVFVLASAAWVIYSAVKYSKASSPVLEPED